MNFILQRYSDNRESTLGLLFLKGSGLFCYTLEDEFRAVKVAKETRIPAGFYELGLRQEQTPMTIRYQQKYPWFKKHIEILKVPNFTGVYIHIGNKDTDTDGCLLLGDVANNNKVGQGEITQSTIAFKRFYDKVYPHLESGKAFIEIRDENKLDL